MLKRMKAVVIWSLFLSVLLAADPLLGVRAQDLPNSADADALSVEMMAEFGDQSEVVGSVIDLVETIDPAAEESALAEPQATVTISVDDPDGSNPDGHRPEGEQGVSSTPTLVPVTEENAGSSHQMFLPMVVEQTNTAEVTASAVEAGRAAAGLPSFSIYGDFNSDGYDDLVLGVPDEDLELSNGETIRDAGVVQVIYGSATGLNAFTVPDQEWHQNSIGIDDRAEDDDWFGAALAVGDFDQDGHDDLAIGIPGEDLEQADGQVVVNAGAVHIIYGSDVGLRAARVRPDKVWHQDSALVNDVAQAQDLFGIVLTAGDFNDDGYVDLAIGVPDEDIELPGGLVIDLGGIVQVLYGSDLGLDPSRRRADQVWSQAGNVDDEIEALDRFGSALAAGDFNGDHFADLAVGVFQEDIGPGFSLSNAGAVNVIYGSGGGLNASIVPDQFWYLDGLRLADQAQADDYFGRTLAVGNFGHNTDSVYDDLAIAATHRNLQGVQYAGVVYVIYGAPGGLNGDYDQRWHQNVPNVEGEAQRLDVFCF